MGIAFRSFDSMICCISRMNDEISWFFACSHTVKKVKVYFGCTWSKYDCDILGLGNLKFALCQGEITKLSWLSACWKWCNTFWLDHQSCSISLTFKYWDSNVVVLVTKALTYLILVYLIVCLSQCCWVLPNFAFEH